MKPAPFAYIRPQTVEDVLAVLAEHNGAARVIAGGQSLVPMLHMRLIQPSVLVDVNRLEGLNRIEVDGDALVVGALVRYSAIEHSTLVLERVPLLVEMVRRIGDRQVRNRGTVGGSIAQADPVGEVPLACLVLGATVVARSVSGIREMSIEEFLLGPYTTALKPDELLVEARFPPSPPVHRFVEVGRRHNDFSVVALSVVGEPHSDGRWSDLRVGIAGGDDHPLVVDLGAVAFDTSGIAGAVEKVLDAVDPLSDVRASSEYRRHLIGVHLRRILEELA